MPSLLYWFSQAISLTMGESSLASTHSLFRLVRAVGRWRNGLVRLLSLVVRMVFGAGEVCRKHESAAESAWDHNP